MLSHELFDAFREDVADVAAPHLWSDSEVWRYMDDAYKMFARLTGGVADTASPITQVPVYTGEATAEVSPLILRFESAHLESTGEPVKIINHTDLGSMMKTDYGRLVPLSPETSTGEVLYMVIGQQRGQVRWVQTPASDDTVSLFVYRLPLDTITGPEQEFSDIGEEHHEHLLLWMKARAYGKQDAETFDKGRREEYKAAFIDYCKAAKAEWERYKSKVRVVAYGGI